MVEVNCMVCGHVFMGEEPKMCCSGYMCGCMGLPVDPIVCSSECYYRLPINQNNFVTCDKCGITENRDGCVPCMNCRKND